MNGGSVAIAVLIGLLSGALAGFVTAPDSDEQSSQVESDSQTETTTTESSGSAVAQESAQPVEVEERPGVSQEQTRSVDEDEIAPPEPARPLDLVAVGELRSRVVAGEGLGCGGAVLFTGFAGDGGGVVPATVAQHGWLVTYFDGETTAELAQESFVNLPAGVGLGEFASVSNLPVAVIPSASYDVRSGLEVAALGFDASANRVVIITGQVTATSPSLLDVRFVQPLPLGFLGAPVLAGSGELIGAIGRNDSVVPTSALSEAGPTPSKDCRTASHDLGSDDYFSAISQEARQVLMAQLFVDTLAVEDWDLARAIDVERGSAPDSQWRDGWGPLERGWVIPLYSLNSTGRWRFGYHTYEARMDYLPSGKSRDAGLFSGSADVNRLFCVTWDVNASAQTVNQGVDVSNRRPQSSEVFDASEANRLQWTRVDDNDPLGLVDTNTLVEEFSRLC